MVTISQIRKIHTLKSIIGLDDDLYRDMLMSFGVQTSKDLTYVEAVIFLEILEEKAVALNRWKKLPKKYSDLNRSDNMATDAQLRMIEGMWREICYFDNDYFATKSHKRKVVLYDQRSRIYYYKFEKDARENDNFIYSSLK